ncbi:hypothetical protein GCM10022267_51620 [Lentzea roselyniae]|uniref:Uncharacterized protein n=1 Tax=Lentzea roselyniae TaxID=531940 RepID=A0ABP7BJ67_9PSEU
MPVAPKVAYRKLVDRLGSEPLRLPDGRLRSRAHAVSKRRSPANSAAISRNR